MGSCTTCYTATACAVHIQLSRFPATRAGPRVHPAMEMTGLEPVTCCVQGSRSPS